MWCYAADAARALVAVTNARIRGEDPTSGKLLSLITATLRPPSQHDSGIFWGVSRADGSGQLSDNIKLAIFGAALQLTIEDLLSGASKVRAPSSLLRRTMSWLQTRWVIFSSPVQLRVFTVTSSSQCSIYRLHTNCAASGHTL